MSGSFSKIRGTSEKCVTMSEWVTNLLVFPKMSKNTPNVWQLAGMYHPAFRCGDWMYLQPCSVEASDTILEYIKSSLSFLGACSINYFTSFQSIACLAMQRMTRRQSREFKLPDQSLSINNDQYKHTTLKSVGVGTPKTTWYPSQMFHQDNKLYVYSTGASNLEWTLPSLWSN